MLPRAVLVLLVALAGALLPLRAAAGDGPFSAAAPVVADRELDRLRGGFIDGRGVFASFGIERSLLVNGQVVVSQSVRIADLSRVSAADLAALRSIAAGAAVFQNTQNNQTIRNSVVIDATTNTLGILQRIGAARALNDALVAPLVRP